ncbi:MAG: low temperature requirement protein A [Lachnospiraceae bacterium]|nr:low temperature requirement protein A [Lachnospiraceae bacterium]
MPESQEKKVEYLELIYDLIFVYLIGRNNSILHYVEDGFVTGDVFLAYVLCSLAVIQIWNFSTFYINLYGRNGVRDHIFLFTNMYLLYHMADGISTGWRGSFYQFCVAWALILTNIGVQHLIEMRNHKAEPWVLEMLKRKSMIILGEAVLVLIHMVVYSRTGMSIAYVPILFGIVATALSGKVNMLVPVDFMHLSERAMLYVVFTFGEMIISITGYFEDRITPSMLYFSAMAFLIVVGLFLSYEILYNKIIDRERTTNGTAYMMIHVFLILALNNISVALEFMREAEVALLPKTMFITGSFVLYFICLFVIGIFSKKCCGFDLKFYLFITLVGISFFAFMFIFKTNMHLNIAISVIYVMAIFLILYKRGRLVSQED